MEKVVIIGSAGPVARHLATHFIDRIRDAPPQTRHGRGLGQEM